MSAKIYEIILKENFYGEVLIIFNYDHGTKIINSSKFLGISNWYKLIFPIDW